MNLVFGLGEETNVFWNEVLMPEASVHYSFELETLQRFERNLIALYYALCEQLNLKVTKKPGATEEQEEILPKGKQGFGLPTSGRLGGA